MADQFLSGAITDDLRVLLDVIYQPFAASSAWPIWQYVELMLDRRGLDATAVLSSVPAVEGISGYGSRYSLVW